MSVWPAPCVAAWCVYEWANTLTEHGPDGLHMQLAPEDLRVGPAGHWLARHRVRAGGIHGLLAVQQRASCCSLLAIIRAPGLDVVAQVLFAGIRVEGAEAYSAADKAMILDAVTSQHGSCEAFDTNLKLQVLCRGGKADAGCCTVFLMCNRKVRVCWSSAALPQAAVIQGRSRAATEPSGTRHVGPGRSTAVGAGRWRPGAHAVRCGRGGHVQEHRQRAAVRQSSRQ
jgi:hypothetical protein